MRLGVHGPPGSGKSLIVALMVKEWFDQGRIIVSLGMDFNPDYIKYRVIEVNELLHIATTGKPFPEELKPDYRGMVLVGDEFYTLADARFRDSASTVFSYIIAQTRKRSMYFVHIEPKRKWADSRIRDLSEKAILCEKWDKETDTICYNDECMKPHKFHYNSINTYTGTKKGFWIKKPEEAYQLYDTKQLFGAIPSMNERILEKQLAGK